MEKKTETSQAEITRQRNEYLKSLKSRAELTEAENRVLKAQAEQLHLGIQIDTLKKEDAKIRDRIEREASQNKENTSKGTDSKLTVVEDEAQVESKS